YHRFVKLNSDGSVNSSTRQAATRFILRDTEGRCVLAYTMNLRAFSINIAEMCGEIMGLELA
ncbi:hypothetical protein LINPERHAP1_LOCUS7627, partial [Linum perenne]